MLSDRPRIRLWLPFVLGLALVAALGGAALAGRGALFGVAAAADPPEVVIKATDDRFNAPSQIEGGRVALTLENDGRQPHHAALLRLNPGTSMDDVDNALAKNPLALLPLVTAVGGPGTVPPGGRDHVTLDLAPGPYVLVCFLPGADGRSHAAKGMVRPLTVVAGPEPPASGPAADATVTLKDFAFQLPAGITPGRHLWRVENDGPEPHELALFKVAPGLKPEQIPGVLAAMAAMAPAGPPAPAAGPPPLTPVGGVEVLDAGFGNWLSLDLDPGSYVAVCFVPDPATGKPHAALGMVMPFTVG